MTFYTLYNNNTPEWAETQNSTSGNNLKIANSTLLSFSDFVQCDVCCIVTGVLNDDDVCKASTSFNTPV